MNSKDCMAMRPPERRLAPLRLTPVALRSKRVHFSDSDDQEAITVKVIEIPRQVTSDSDDSSSESLGEDDRVQRPQAGPLGPVCPRRLSRAAKLKLLNKDGPNPLGAADPLDPPDLSGAQPSSRSLLNSRLSRQLTNKQPLRTVRPNVVAAPADPKSPDSEVQSSWSQRVCSPPDSEFDDRTEVRLRSSDWLNANGLSRPRDVQIRPLF